ncbi:MAG: OstA-like protein [Rikenellaceae bacterium]
MMYRRLITIILSILPSFLFSQQQVQRPEKSLIRLIDAKSAVLTTSMGREYREIKGPAQFLHDNTLILCDSAVWDTQANIVDAIGHVKIIQKNTTLYSDNIKYLADQSLAQVRGNLVELVDNEGGRLRTNFIDYFTKDSIGMFYNGGCLMNKDSSFIESSNGYYYAKEDRFLFQMKVEMQSDTVLMKTDSLAYLAKENKAVFLTKTLAWQGDGFLMAKGGWYDRNNEYIHFSNDVYIKTKNNEIWAKEIDFDRKTGNAKLEYDVQVLDTAQSAIILADRVNYTSKPESIVLEKEPSIALFTVENEVRDTLFFSADTIIYQTRLHKDVDSSVITISKQRRDLSKRDPITEIYSSLKAKASLLNKTNSDTVNVDTLTVNMDTVKVKFLTAFKNVKFYRSNIQGVCDSLQFNSLDSLIRLYKEPIIWNENKQLSADSIQVILSGRKLKKAELNSSAFVVMQEDSSHYDQVKSADIIIFFDDGKLSKFDALGSASVLFFFEEDSVLTTMNEKECKALSATMLDNKIHRVRYFENINSNAYPLFNLPDNKQKLKGFKWADEKRPKNRYDVCNRSIKSSQASTLEMAEKPLFTQFGIYFPKTKK